MPLPKKELFLPYHPVVAADQQEGIDSCPIEFILGEAKEGRGEKWPTAEVEKQLFFPRIAEQIQLLAASGTPFSDQAILVKDRYQAQRVAEFLQEHNIASLLQRSELLTNTEAFLDVEIILQATLDRAEGFVQALSTRLFGWDSERLFAVKKQMESDPWKVASVAVPFHRFLQVLHESGVGAWYRAVLDETGAVEGLLQQKGGEEYLDAFTQVVEALVRYQTTTGARGHALLCGFEQIQQWVQNEEPEGFLRPLMDSSAVSILTLHASKGLEFPVVFALGVINRTSMQHPLLRSADRLVVASDKEKTRPFFQEIDAEKLRQLYVALTRAKKKLYIPVLFALDAKKPPLSGQASAMELLLSQIAEGKQKESFQQWLSSYPFFGVVDPISDLPDTPKQVQSQELFVPKEVHWQKEGRKILSFSGLARSSSLHREEKLSVSVTNPLQVEESPCSFLSKEQLPAGTQTGKALHAIFEKIPWGKQALPWLDTDEGKACLGKLWPYKEVIASVVDRVFSAPLHPFSWCLQDVLPEDVAREMEFVYQEGKNYVKGFVDTIFLYQDRYWIVDWKSNVLDPDLPCKTAVQQKMEEHQYFLQAAIYQKAMNKHLAQHDPLQRKIGGAFYIFIRANSPDGIVFLPAKEQKKSH